MSRSLCVPKARPDVGQFMFIYILLPCLSYEYLDCLLEDLCACELETRKTSSALHSAKRRAYLWWVGGLGAGLRLDGQVL